MLQCKGDVRGQKPFLGAAVVSGPVEPKRMDRFLFEQRRDGVGELDLAA